MSRMVIDPYQVQSPIAAAIAALGKAMMSGPSAAETDYYRARTGHADLQSEGVRREHAGFDAAGNALASTTFDPAAFQGGMAGALRGGMKPANVADLYRLGAYSQNAPQATRDRSFLAAGGNAAATETGHGQTLANAIQRAGIAEGGAMARTQATIAGHRDLELTKDARVLMPAMVDGPEGPRLVMRPKSQVGSDVFAGTPVLTAGHYATTERPDGKFEAQPYRPGLTVPGPFAKGQPFNMRLPDGSVVASRTGTETLHGAPIPAGSQLFSVQTSEPIGAAEGRDLRNTSQAQERLGGTIGDLRQRLATSPASLGAVGTLRSTLQSALQQGDAFAQTLGIDVGKARDAVGRVDASLLGAFDPNLPQIDLLANLVAYQAAGVLAGQQGRDISNADFTRFRNMIGDSSVLGNPREMNARLDVIEQQLSREVKATGARLGGGSAKPAPIGMQPPASAPGKMRYNPQTGTLE